PTTTWPAPGRTATGSAPPATPPSTPTRPTRSTGWSASRRSSRPSSSGCAKARTRPSSTSTSMSAPAPPATKARAGPRTARAAAERPAAASTEASLPLAGNGPDPSGPFGLRGRRDCPHCIEQKAWRISACLLTSALPTNRSPRTFPDAGHAPHAAHRAPVLRDGPAALPLSRGPVRAEIVHGPSGRQCRKAERRAVQAGLPPVAERALPPLLRRMRGLPFRPHPGGGLRAEPEPAPHHPPERLPAPRRDEPLGDRGPVRALPPLPRQPPFRRRHGRHGHLRGRRDGRGDAGQEPGDRIFRGARRTGRTAEAHGRLPDRRPR